MRAVLAILLLLTLAPPVVSNPVGAGGTVDTGGSGVSTTNGGATRLSDGKIVVGSNPSNVIPGNIATSLAGVDGTGLGSFPGGVDATCAPGSNTCGGQVPENVSDCLANGSPGSPGTDIVNYCWLKDANQTLGVLMQLGDRDGTRRPVAVQSMAGRTSDAATVGPNSGTETDLSGPITIEGRTNRVLPFWASGTMQASTAGATHYLIYVGDSSGTKALDIATPAGFQVTTASTPYFVSGVCTLRLLNGASSTVHCGGCLQVNQETAPRTGSFCADQQTTVTLSSASIIKSRVQLTSGASNSWIETQFSVFQGDGLANLTTATTSTSTSTTSTSTSSTTSTTLGTTNPPSWENATGIVAFWNFESTDGTSSGSCGTNCDLTTVTGTPAAYTTTHPYGAKAVQFTTADGLTRATGNASLQFNDNVTVAGWYRFPSSLPAGTVNLFRTDGSANRGIMLAYNGIPNRWFIETGDNVTNYTKTLGGIAVTADSWWFVGVTNKSDKTVEITGFNGAATNSTQSQTNAGSVVVNVGDGFGLNTITANSANVILDEQLLASVPLTSAELCRICSCGLDGTHPPDGSSACTCTGTAWNTLGANATMCGGCSVSGLDCNAAAPIGR